ncbi:MAG TPA: response regulator [Chloroflexota bacterium]|jgi:CheY-like chemotaxis protein
MPFTAPLILVAEDDAATSDLLQQLLREEGYAVERAANGAEVLAQLADRVPDLVLLDWMMPAVDGDYILRLLAARQVQSPPIILMSASNLLPSTRPDGVVAMIDKPFELDDLLAVIAQHCPPPGTR